MFHRFSPLWTVVGLWLVGSFSQADDLPPHAKMISVEVVIAEFSGTGKGDDGDKTREAEDPAERLKQLEKQGRVGTVARIRLSTLDKLPASVQIGERTPVVTGRTRIPDRGGGGGAFSNAMTIQSIGTIVSVTPHVEDDGVVVVLEIERSRLVPAAAAGENANEDGIPRTVTVQAKNTVRVPTGQTVMVSGAKTTAREESGELLVSVSARVMDSPKAKQAAANAAEKQSKVYFLRHAKADLVGEAVGKLRQSDERLQKMDLAIGVDSRTNSVVAFGAADALAAVEEIVRKMDQGR